MEKTQQTEKVFTCLEDKYPEFDRRPKWILTGFQTPTQYNLPKPTIFNPSGKIPVWRYVGWDVGKKYTGKVLRNIRKQRNNKYV